MCTVDTAEIPNLLLSLLARLRHASLCVWLKQYSQGTAVNLMSF